MWDNKSHTCSKKAESHVMNMCVKVITCALRGHCINLRAENLVWQVNGQNRASYRIKRAYLIVYSRKKPGLKKEAPQPAVCLLSALAQIQLLLWTTFFFLYLFILTGHLQNKLRLMFWKHVRRHWDMIFLQTPTISSFSCAETHFGLNRSLLLDCRIIQKQQYPSWRKSLSFD